MFIVHSKRNTEDGFATWEDAATRAVKMIMQEGANDVWIEDDEDGRA